MEVTSKIKEASEAIDQAATDLKSSQTLRMCEMTSATKVTVKVSGGGC